MGGVEYQVTKVDPTDPHTKGAVYQVHKVSEEIAATLGGKVYRARIIKDPTDPAVAGKVYQIVLIGDPSDPAVKGKVYNAILTGGSEAVIVGPAVSPLVLPDAVAGELDYVKAYGGTEQNGTPTPDAPVDIVSNNGAIKYSKNLLDMSTENIVLGKYINNSGAVLDSGPNFYNSKYIPVVGGETYTWSTSSSIGYFSVMEYDSGYVFKRRTLFGSSSSSPAGTSGTVTLRSDTAFVLIGSNMDSVDITLDRIAAVDWQFEKGTSATAYKPYSPTGIYTDGTVETVEVTGVNLNGGGELENQGYTSTGGTSTSMTFCGTLWKIKVKEGEKYTVSYGNFPDGISGVFVNTWKTDGTWNLRQAISISSAYTYTIPTGIGEVNFTLYKTGGITIADNSWLQVEKGDTATDYEPYYNGGSATAEMLLKVGDYRDVQSVLDGSVTRNQLLSICGMATIEQLLLLT